MTKIIRFAHLADLHLGGWREKKLTELNFQTFVLAIDRVISENVEFCLFAGDIFNNAMPPIELVEKVVSQLIRLKNVKIPLYIIGGSHDYSNTGKSFLQLLDTAGVFIDVCKFEYLDKNKINLKFTKDDSGTVISGVLGKKNGLDKNIYNNLNDQTLSKDNFNIFMFHTTLNDMKPDFMKAVKSEVNSSFLPKGFDYYAAGHVHTYIEGHYGDGKVCYPGCLFPNNFAELRKEVCSFNLCSFNFDTRKTKIDRVILNTYEKEFVRIEIDKLNPIEAKSKIEDEISKIDFAGKILLMEITGVIEGKVSDININKIVFNCYNSGALVVLKNTYKLTSSSLQVKSVDVSEGVSDIEKEIVEEILSDSENKKMEGDVISNLFSLELGKIDGEKVAQYEERVTTALEKVLVSFK